MTVPKRRFKIKKNTEKDNSLLGNAMGVCAHESSDSEVMSFSEEFYQILFESAGDAIFVLENNKFIACNKSAVHAFGCLDKTDIVGHKTCEFSPDIQPDGVRSEQKEVSLISSALDGHPQRFDWKYLKKNGEMFDGAVSLSCIKIQEKVYLQLIVRDISTRKQTESDLRERANKLLEAQRMANIGNWYWDIATGDVEWSEEVYKIFKLDPGNFTPQIDSVMALSPWPEDNQRHNELIKRVISTNEIGTYEQRFLYPDGSSGYYLSTFQGVFDENNRLIGIKGVVQDITERKLVEEALVSSERLFRLLTENSSDMIYRMSLISRIYEYISPAAFKITGYSPEEYYADPKILYKFVHPDSREYFREQWNNLLQGEMPPVYEYKIIHKSGVEKWLHQRNTAVYDDDGNLIAIEGIVTDITERKLAEIELEALIKDLEQKNAEMERFNYTVSHDLKTPLVTIESFLKLIKDDECFQSRSNTLQFIERIEHASIKMRDLLDDLLEFSKIGHLINPSSEINLNELVDEAIELLYSSIQNQNVKVEIDSDLPVLYGDRPRLFEVVLNLLENAVKYMGQVDQPEIHIGVKQVDKQKVVYVKDNGIGIKPEYFEKIFQLFDKLDGETEGTGIGLSIVKRIVEVHGGKIWVESEGPYQGTCFYFYLPEADM